MAKIADVQEVSLELLRPYERNAKKHGSEQIEKLKASIMEFGFLTPCLIDNNYNIIAGHGRVMAAKELGIQTVPCVFIEGLTEEQRRAYILADNRLGELGEWDMDLVFEELSELDDLGFDVELTGFEMPDEELDVVEDDFDEDSVPEESRCKLGDLWQLGDHRLICGDSTDVNVIERLMGGQKADMVYTDPPYGMGLNSDFSSMHSKMNTDFGDRQMKGTNYQIGKVDSFSEEMVDTIYSINAPETFMWGADYYAELIPNRNEGSWIVWDKRTNDGDTFEEGDVALDRGYGSCFELCYSKKKHKRNIARVKWSGLFGMEHEFDRKRVHPTQKPTRLASWFISRYSKDDGVIVDLFGGSGSTLIACEQLNRRCYMCELDPHYCDVIISRWETFTGRGAVLING